MRFTKFYTGAYIGANEVFRLFESKLFFYTVLQTCVMRVDATVTYGGYFVIAALRL